MRRKFLAYSIACMGLLSVLLVQTTLAWSTASAENSGNSITAAEDFGLTVSYSEIAASATAAANVRIATVLLGDAAEPMTADETVDDTDGYTSIADDETDNMFSLSDYYSLYIKTTPTDSSQYYALVVLSGTVGEGDSAKTEYYLGYIVSASAFLLESDVGGESGYDTYSSYIKDQCASLVSSLAKELGVEESAVAAVQMITVSSSDTYYTTITVGSSEPVMSQDAAPTADPTATVAQQAVGNIIIVGDDDTSGTDDTDDTGGTDDTDDTDDTGSTDDTDDTGSTDDTDDTGSTDDTDDTGSTDDTDDTGSTDDTDDTGSADDTNDTGSTDDTDDTGNTDETPSKDDSESTT